MGPYVDIGGPEFGPRVRVLTFAQIGFFEESTFPVVEEPRSMCPIPGGIMIESLQGNRSR